MPSRSALASSCQTSSTSQRSGWSASTSRRRSGGSLSVRICPASSAIACCSSLSSKSTSVPRDSGELQAEQGDEVALHLVGAAAEGQDQRALEGALDPEPQPAGGGVGGR